MAMPIGHNGAPRAVISLHGIRTRGEWQKSLSPEITKLGIEYHPWDYGFFATLSLLNPGARRKVVNSFRDYYHQVRQTTDGPISVVAHSFGTYIVAQALADYPPIKLDRVIFCGSIVPTDYDWSNVIETRGQVAYVLNQFGKSDIWVRLVGWAVSSAGPSGYNGFEDLANGRVTQQAYKSFKHSQYFFGLNYAANWIPFLLGDNLPDTAPLRPQRVNLKFRTTVVILLLAISLGALLWFRPSVHGGQPDQEEKPRALELTGESAPRAKSAAESAATSPGDSSSAATVDRVIQKNAAIAGSSNVGTAKSSQVSQSAVKGSNARMLELLQGNWVSNKTELESGDNGCNQSSTAANTLQINGLNQDGTISGRYTEVMRITAVIEKSTPSVNYVIPQELCNKQTHGDSEVSVVTRSEHGTVQLELRKQKPEIYIDIESCTVGDNDCPPDEYGLLDFGNFEILGQATKLAIGDRIYTKVSTQ